MKRSAEAQRLASPATPLPVLPRQTQVRVYTGAGWESGYVTDSSPSCCCVFLPHHKKFARCFDARNLKTA